jgi:integrase
MFGTIRKLPSGNYQARYPHPDRPGVQLSAGTFRRRSDAANALKTVSSRQVRGDWVDPRSGRVTLREWSTTWLDSLRLRPRTIEAYETAMRVHVLPSLGDVQLGKLTPQRVRAWFDEREATGKLTAAAKAYGALQTCLNAAVEAGLIRVNPCTVKGATTPPRPKRPRALEVAEVEVLHSAMPDRYRAWLRVAVYGGPRWSEGIALRVGDVDFGTGLVHISRTLVPVRGGGWATQPTKTVAGERSVVLPPSVLAELEQHVERFSDGAYDSLVFTSTTGTPLQKANFRQRVWLPATASLSWRPTVHDLRHTYASFAIRAGADVTRCRGSWGTQRR